MTSPKDILTHGALPIKRGAPGVDGETFTHIEGYGVDRWLNTVRDANRTLQTTQPVKRDDSKVWWVGQRPLPYRAG